ncbi:MAG: Carboxyl-terminal protease [Berkelbacteria bacterium GW2011_GWA2_46_7]|uniref:Carboxyl-terminal protease n=1 Tax=Berkelbacteria bacterium GW2011_GWA2_46_7 TaxID=1618335 RepID=A0A0G1TFY3_9BACT|nr:MAG: Carboxyl-terminal protease [Berkelbacteria bacterium GW2011_GWA2_46_7]
MRPLNDLPKLSVKPKFKYVRHILLALVLFAVLGGGYILGQTTTNARQKLDLNQFWQVYDIINRRYVGSIDQKAASEGAVAGLVSSLGDPFSMYLPAEARKNLDSELKGEFEGIGAELTQKDGLITVVTPLDGSPAATAGLMPKDIVLKIGDESTSEMLLDEAVSKIRGPKGTTVTLEVARPKVSDPIKLTITRDAIHVKSVESEILSGNIGYLEIRQFGDDTVESVKKSVADLAKIGPRAVIIDLRNNPGGYLDAVAPIAGQFIAPNVVVKEKYKGGRIEPIPSKDVPVMPNTPLFILVNGGSASAAEILAGALQDYKRATLVGQKTFGKGSVQDIIPLKAGAALRLTIAEWLTPNDRQISKKGIDPDVVVEGDKKPDSDPVLAKALEIITKNQ